MQHQTCVETQVNFTSVAALIRKREWVPCSGAPSNLKVAWCAAGTIIQLFDVAERRKCRHMKATGNLHRIKHHVYRLTMLNRHATTSWLSVTPGRCAHPNAFHAVWNAFAIAILQVIIPQACLQVRATGNQVYEGGPPTTRKCKRSSLEKMTTGLASGAWLHWNSMSDVCA